MNYDQMYSQTLGMGGKLAEERLKQQLPQIEPEPAQVTPQARMPLLGFWNKPAWLYQIESSLGLPPL